jgi:hypothetical protein
MVVIIAFTFFINFIVICYKMISELMRLVRRFFGKLSKSKKYSVKEDEI